MDEQKEKPMETPNGDGFEPMMILMVHPNGDFRWDQTDVFATKGTMAAATLQLSGRVQQVLLKSMTLGNKVTPADVSLMQRLRKRGPLGG